MCAICWSGGQIIPATAVAWRYWSVNRIKPIKAIASSVTGPEHDSSQLEAKAASRPMIADQVSETVAEGAEALAAVTGP